MRFQARSSSGSQLWTALLCVIVGAVLTRDVWLLLRHPVAVGLDGYYYVLQVESLYEKGTLFFRSSTPLVIYLLFPLKFFVNDTILAIKLGSLLFHMAIVGGVYAILLSLTRSKLHATCGALIVTASSVHLFMLSEYVANAGGLAFLVWGAYFTLRAVRAGKMLWMVSAIICLLCAGLSHRSLAFMIAALAIVCLIYYLMTAAGSHGKRLWAGAIGLALFISPLVLASQTIVDLPAVVRASLLTSPRFSVGWVAILEKLLLLVCSLLFLFITLKKKRRTQPLAYMTLGTAAMLSLLLTINPFLDRSAGWFGASERISAISYVQLALLLPGLFWLLSHFARRLWPVCPLTAICFAAFSLVMPLPYGLRDDYLLDRVSLVNELIEKRPSLAGVQRVIAPHGQQFLITYALGVPAQQRMREGEDSSMTHWLVQRLEGVNVSSVEGAIILSESRSTFLVPDKHLDALLRTRPIKETFELTKANPHLMDRILSATGTYRVSIE